mmetsp:Transcript_18430/g.31523  ORF Transcript_18430/g.31523 Transcript_18430/m.31523 type:complete len:85 (+) Transcript_18430:991-1245(+)
MLSISQKDGFLVSMSVDSDPERGKYNQCGVRTNHAYAYLRKFNMTQAATKTDEARVFTMAEIKNPLRYSSYFGKWSPFDRGSWT